MEHILSILIFFPLFAAILGLLVDKETIRFYAIVITTIEFCLSLFMWYGFDSSIGSMQLTQIVPLITQYGITYNVGVDGISLFLILMTTFITMISIIALADTKHSKHLILTVLFLEMAMVGVFVSLDVIIFYVFWEFSLLPMLYIIGAWGGERRIYASIKFFLYTFTGSLVMLLGMLYIAYVYFETTGTWSFSLLDWNTLQFSYATQLWLFGAFFLGFAIKVPMVPFHTWLPYAHGQAPTIGSVILAAVLLKMGTYGFIRFSLPLFPDATIALVIPMALLAIIAIIYTAMLAFAQEDIKQVIAYSSVSHMGVIILGIFAINVEGVGGSIFLMVSHGIVSAALFILVGVIYDRKHTKMMSEFGGLAKVMPMYALIFGIMLMASVGLPLTIGFVGEFLSLLGFFAVSPILASIAGLTIILGAVYMLALYKKTFFGPILNASNLSLKDLNSREYSALIPMVVLVIFLGVYPKPILEPVEKSVKHTIQMMYLKSENIETKEFIARVNTVGEKR
jgi:NADH-quinone oxidoreductase subunit M